MINEKILKRLTNRQSGLVAARLAIKAYRKMMEESPWNKECNAVKQDVTDEGDYINIYEQWPVGEDVISNKKRYILKNGQLLIEGLDYEIKNDRIIYLDYDFKIKKD